MTLDELPQDVESERAVLGSLLLNREAIAAVASALLPEHFYYDRHAQLYAVMLDLFGRRVPTDTRTVWAELKARGLTESCGGLGYLSDLVDSVPTSYHITYYARPIIATAERRKGITAGADIARIFYTEPDVETARAQAQTVLTQAVGGRMNRVATSTETMDEAWDDFTREDDPAIATGFYDLDELIGGFYPGELIILGARPSVGKTAFSLSLLANVCGRRDPTPLLFVSLEMKRREIGRRLVAMDAGIDLRALRMRRITEDERARWVESYGKIGAWSYVIADASTQTPATIRAIAMRLLAEHPRMLIVVDYIGLMTSGKRTNNRQEEVSEISRQLKILAGDANVPLLALSQLSRAVEGRADQRPVLSDFRESGSLEQDADVAMFLHRPGVERDDGTRVRATETHLLIEKARNGPTGVVRLQFQPETTRFVTLDRNRTPDGY